MSDTHVLPPRSEDGMFSPAMIGFVVAGLVAIFALSVLLATLHTDGPVPAGPTAESPSAIGHKGFYTLLQQLGVPVSLHDAAHPVDVRRRGLVVIDEFSERDLFAEGSAAADAAAILVVLPKWTGAPDFLHRGWVREIERVDLNRIKRIAARLGSQLTVGDIAPTTAWTLNRFAVAPLTDTTTQVLRGPGLIPVIATKDDILLAEIRHLGPRLFVLADPDPLQNHGITKPANARFAIALVNALRRGGPVVFDEKATISPPDRNPIRLLFGFPFALVTAQIVAALGLLILATTTRFGGVEREAPAFGMGKLQLVETIAALMDRAGHRASVLRRYIAERLGDAGRRSHAPAGLDDISLARWLDRSGAARGLPDKAEAILARSASRGRRGSAVSRLAADARDIYRWHEDLIDGSRGRQSDR